MIDPIILCNKYLDNLNPKNVLDLGGGSGKKTLRFLEKGAQVTIVDKKNFNFKNKNLEFIQEDIKNFKFIQKYGLIVASLVLHFMSKGDAEKIIEKVKENTNELGYNFLICMSNEDECSKERPGNFYPTLKILKDIYSDWEIIGENNDFTSIEEHDNLPAHRHNLIVLLVKKNKKLS
tara:strand:- start:673 stop:1203 length:531 start_codon:yes stop_codon:yes gene_type:complete